jgi:hypothetical protein
MILSLRSLLRKHINQQYTPRNTTKTVRLLHKIFNQSDNVFTLLLQLPGCAVKPKEKEEKRKETTCCTLE